jgi:tricorn protease
MYLRNLAFFALTIINLQAIKPVVKPAIKPSKWYARCPTLAQEEDDGEEYIYFPSGTEIFRVKITGGTPELCYSDTNKFCNLVSHKNYVACICSTPTNSFDMYLFDVKTRTLTRLTFFERDIAIVKFETIDGEDIIWFLSNKEQPFSDNFYLYSYNLSTKIIKNHQIGPIEHMDYDANDQIVQKDGYGYIHWKRYGGGATGKIYYKNGKKLLNLRGNAICPTIVGNRIFFLHDDWKCGNIYSCDKNGENLTQHTFHKEFQVRDLTKCGNRLLYTVAGQIYIYDIKKKKEQLIELTGHVTHPSSKSFAPNPYDFLSSIDTDGEDIVIADRGNISIAGGRSGGAIKLNDELRYSIAGISNYQNEKYYYAFKNPPNAKLTIFDKNKKLVRNFTIDESKIGLVKSAGQFLCYTNHRHELRIIDTLTGTDKIIAKGKCGIYGFDWLGEKYIAYSISNKNQLAQIMIYDIEKNQHYAITDASFLDFCPTFDPNGEYLAFISNRNAQYNFNIHTADLQCEEKRSIHVVPLQKYKSLLTPWVENKKSNVATTTQSIVNIDFDNIHERVIQLPKPLNNFIAIHAIHDNKLLLISDNNQSLLEVSNNITVEIFCMKMLASNIMYNNLKYFRLSDDKKNCIVFYNNGNITITTKNKEEIPLNLIRFQSHIDQKQEWKQMLQETCWIIKEFYWEPSISGINTDQILEKYMPYCDSIRTKQELYDIIANIFGEIATSHFGYYNNRCFGKSTYLHLGCILEYQAPFYRITKILHHKDNPIVTANANVQVGEIIFSIDGVTLDINNPPEKILSAKTDQWATIEIGTETNKRIIEVKLSTDVSELFYQDWVALKRKYVHEKSNGKIGYIHIPTMFPDGFKKFIHAYNMEHDKQGIIIDVRNNWGGMISTNLIRQLQIARGFDSKRWDDAQTIPNMAHANNLVLLVNSHSCSDTEVFAQLFKEQKMGPVIGERTWGGVTGHALFKHQLIDGFYLAIPELSSWFKSTKFDIENHGVQPDIVVENKFDDDKDLQLDIAIQEALSKAKQNENLVEKYNETPLRLKNKHSDLKQEASNKKLSG